MMCDDVRVKTLTLLELYLTFVRKSAVTPVCLLYAVLPFAYYTHLLEKKLTLISKGKSHKICLTLFSYIIQSKA